MKTNATTLRGSHVARLNRGLVSGSENWYNYCVSKQDEMFNTKIDWQARLSAKKSAKFEELFPAQEAALNAYSAEFLNIPNVAIELPTGSGKSLIAAMILDFWKDQGKRTAVLCGTKNLARQFKDEVDALGVPTILFEAARLVGRPPTNSPTRAVKPSRS